MARSTCGSLWYESVENAPEDFWEVVSRGETSSARDEEEKNKDQNKGQRKKREETNAPETVVLCFAVVARKREENRRRTERKRKVYPGFFLLKKSKSKKILTLQVLKRAPVGLLHDDDRLPPRSCFTPRSLCAFFCFFSAGGSRRARAALVFSRMKCREREREEGGFRLGKYDRQKRERERERKIFIFAREKKRRAAFWDLRWSESLTPRREPLRSLEGGFPSLSTTAVKIVL